jgi:hypothetical protein
MTEDELKARGYPRGDAELLERFIHYFNRQPKLAFGLANDSEWGRAILYEAVAMEVAASHGKSVRLGSAIGPWKAGEPTGYEPQPRRRRGRKPR